MNSNDYIPHPVDVSDIKLPAELEVLAEISRNEHGVWSQNRMREV
jgi:hypothetical protein